MTDSEREQEPLKLFTEEQAAGLTGLSPRQLSYWGSTNFFASEHTIDGGAFRRIYSFRDIVGLRTIARLLDRGISLKELRKVGEWLQREHETPWAGLKFWVGGKRVYFSDPTTGVPLTADDRTQGGFAVALDEIAAEMIKAAAELHKRRAGSVGQISRIRHVLGHAPVIAGTRIAAATIADMFRDGSTVEEIIAEFPQITKEDVIAAVQWDQARSKEKTPRRRNTA